MFSTFGFLLCSWVILGPNLVQEEAGLDYRGAWNAAVAEYNSYGLAAHDPKLQVDKSTANLMFGFKVIKLQQESKTFCP